jgi:MFS family permease
MSRDQLRRSRIATAVAFCVTGAVFASWAARIPAVQDRLQLGSGGLAIALLGIEAGAIVGLPASGALVGHIGTARSLRLGYALYPPAMAFAAVAPSLAWLTTGLVVVGATNSLIDVAANVQGVELERRAGRPLLSGLHSGHSFGVLGGGLAATAAAALGIDTTVHLGVVALGALAIGQAAATALLRDQPTRAEDPRSERRLAGRAGLAAPNAQLLLLGAVACCAFFVEGAANDWSAVHLRTAHDASPGMAAAAFTAFSLALAVGRLSADRLVAKHGRARFTRLSGVVAAAGAGVAAVAPSAAVALAGWTLLGAGIAAIAPTLLGAAPAASQAHPPHAIATVTTIGYSGSFAGPPVIGALGTLVGLSSALGALVAGSLAVTLLAGRALRGRRARPPDRPPIGAQIAPRSRQYYDPSQRTTCPEGGEIPANQPFL